jgi:hypothetical protein
MELQEALGLQVLARQELQELLENKVPQAQPELLALTEPQVLQE